MRSDCELQRTGARRRLPRSEITEELLEELGSVIGVGTLQRKHCSAETRDRLGGRVLEQPLSLVESSLSEPQVAESRHGWSGHRRTRVLQLARRRGELI